MAFRRYNANPNNNDTGDCVVRALSEFLEVDWNEAFLLLMLQGYKMKLYPTNNNFVWGTQNANPMINMFNTLMRRK